MFTGILQPTHLIIVLIVALVFLGPKRLPDAGRALGQGLKEFKNSINSPEDNQQITQHQPPPKQTPHMSDYSDSRGN